MQKQGVSRANVSVSALDVGILNTLLYFDIFKYPLLAEEISRLHPQPHVNACDIQLALDRLLASGVVECEDQFYRVLGSQACATRRKKGNALAANTMQRAYKRSRFIARFPYVRGVMISGSLSKNYMEDGSDIDFFVVTATGRLWIARTLLILYKKVFLFNSHKEFCMNYFVDTDHLEIEDKNIFTATEIMFLLPTYGPEQYRGFHEANVWAAQYYPNYGLRDLTTCAPVQDPGLKRFGEWLLGGRMGERLDAWCLRKTLARWRNKFSHFSQEKFDVALRSRKYVSKHHPSHFQEKVMSQLKARQSALEAQFGIELPAVTSSPQQQTH